MKFSNRSTLKQFLVDTLPDWDHENTPHNVRQNLWKVINCGTPALGAEVFASETETKVVYHTCKSRFCPSCGARESGIWQDQLEALIPKVPYREVNLTMPSFFWSFFRRHRHLLNNLAGVGARAIEFWAKATHGVRVILMVVLQTSGGFLNFYPHLHTLVSAGGLDESRLRWIPDLDLIQEKHKHELMLAWRYALIAYVDAAIDDGVVGSGLATDELRIALKKEGARNWNIYVGPKRSKRIVIDHIGRYIRKPPVVQPRLTRISDNEVQYFAKDTKNRRLTPVRYTNREFLALLLPHVVDRYCNSMRYFGLLAPRAKFLLAIAFDLLKQERSSKPARLSWATALYKTFGENPLVGTDGLVLRKAGRISPIS